MWISEQGRRRAEPDGTALVGRVTLPGDPAGVYLAGERRELPVFGPGGYVWRPEEGEQVLVLKTGGRPGLRAGLEPGGGRGAHLQRFGLHSHRRRGYPADRRCAGQRQAGAYRGGLSVELMVRNGDYVSDGAGGFLRAEGTDELLQRVLWKLSIPRGSFPLLPALGSELHRLDRAKPAERAGLARQYVAQALSDEAELSVAGVELSAEGELTVELDWRGEALRLILGTGGV